MRRIVLLSAAALAAVLVAAPAVSAPKTVTTTAKLKGANEVPNPGDPDGRGKAVVRLKSAKQKVCYVLTMKRIAMPAAAAHIHVGEAGVPGPVVVPLFTEPVDRHRVKRCVDATSETIDQIRANPKGYYVNVHNAEYPGGAIRGQLRKRKIK